MASEIRTEENKPTSSMSSKFSPVGSVPTVFYIPDYITPTEEEQLLNNIYKAPVSKWKSLKNRRLQNWGGVVHEKGLLAQDLPLWLKQITSRVCKESELFSSTINHVLINEYLPDQGIMSHQDGPAYEPVVAILSLGSPIVMDFVPHPSLIESTSGTSGNLNIDMLDKPEDAGINSNEPLSEYLPFSIALMPRSLLIFKDRAYSDYMHGIKDCEKHQYDKAVNFTEALELELRSDVAADNSEAHGNSIIHRNATRVSLTCRVVKKVHKNLIKL